MHNQIIRTQRDPAHDFVVKRLDRPNAHHWIGSPQIDQVIGMDDQRAEAKFGAPGAKLGGFDFRDARADARPHARAGGKDLQCVTPEFRGAFERACEAVGDGSMNADANAAVAPGWRLRLGRWFGAVFVAAIVVEDRTVGRRHLLVAEPSFYRIAAVAANFGGNL